MESVRLINQTVFSLGLMFYICFTGGISVTFSKWHVNVFFISTKATLVTSRNVCIIVNIEYPSLTITFISVDAYIYMEIYSKPCLSFLDAYLHNANSVRKTL